MGRHRSPARLSPRETFELFIERTDELSRMRIIRNQGLSNEWSVSMGQNQPTVFRSVQPDEEDFRSYLMAFRKFVSKEEPVFIGYIHGLCYKHFTSDELKGHIQNCQRGWRENVKRGGIKLNFHGRDIEPEDIADLWINGHYFHDDPEKAQELKRYMPYGTLVMRQELLQVVIEVTRVIGGSGYTIKMALPDGAARS